MSVAVGLKLSEKKTFLEEIGPLKLYWSLKPKP